MDEKEKAGALTQADEEELPVIEDISELEELAAEPAEAMSASAESAETDDEEEEQFLRGEPKEAEELPEEEPEEEAPDRKKEKKHKERKKGRAGKVIGILAIIVVCALGVAYGVGAYYYSSHFYRQTIINGFDFSNQTPDEVVAKLTEEVKNYTLTIQERENMTETIAGSEIDMEMLFDVDFDQMLKEQSPLAWPKGLFAESVYDVGSSISYDEQKLEDAVALLKAADTVTMITPIDASVQWSDSEDAYVVDPGVEGTQLDVAQLTTLVQDAVRQISPTLDLEEADCYAPQSITPEDERLASAAEDLNRIASATVTYDIYGNTEVCDSGTIRTWLSLDENYEVLINEELARAYIDTLGDKYNTYGTTRSFTTHDGQIATITKGDYGWRMNRADTTTELVAAVREGGDQQKEILWLQTANSLSANDWGNTYVEIDLSNQHVYFYKNGELIVESDCVSGKMTSERMTPSGIYSLKYKEKNRTLRGQQQSDGSYEYESFVNFWMPFNGGIGMHDSSWRSSYGGTIYVNSGSHGCINLPYAKASAIYENIESGTPVICYYRDSVSSASSSSDESSEDTSTADTSAEDTSADDTSAEDTSTADTSAEDASAGDTSTTEDTSAEDASTEDTSAEDTSAEDTSAEDTSTTDASATDTSAE